MSEPSPKPDSAAAKKEHPPRTSKGSDPDRALLALLFFIVFATGCYLLVRELRREARMQDCLAHGRRNCDLDGMPAVNDR